jgi:uncharacterized membrane protein
LKDLHTWLGIFAVVAFSTAGDVLIANAMKRVGDVGPLWRKTGTVGVLKSVGGNVRLWVGVACMAGAFFSLLLALSWADVSLVGPASASLTFLSNAFFARFFLHERVDRRRWIAALLVAGGVALVAI